MNTAGLPDYERPPVVETILGVQFAKIRGLTNAHLGAFWQYLGREDWPNAIDAPPVPAQFERFEKAPAWAGAGARLTLTQDLAVRIQLRNAQNNRMLQIQNGRLHLNWLGFGGDAYPRYDNVRADFEALWMRFRDFSADLSEGELRPNQWEVTYLNHILRGSVWETPADWGFFRHLHGVETTELVEPESFSGNWQFAIPNRRGRLHVQWQHAQQPGNAEELIRLTMTARGPLPSAPSNDQTILDGLDLGRDTIVRFFRDSMSEEANQHWGLAHAGD